MSHTRAIYQAIRAGDPKAVAYYRELKVRIEDGKKAELILAAIQAVHEEHKASVSGYAPPYQPLVDCMERGDMFSLMRAQRNQGPHAMVGAEGHITPNGYLLTQGALSQLVSACYAAAYK